MRLPDPNAMKANQNQVKSLEALLATKNRKMEEELTRFRVCMHINAQWF
jgi:homeobox protein cut-like